MSDSITGEVLVPASRFLPNCEHGKPEAIIVDLVTFDQSEIVKVGVLCEICHTKYRHELPLGVEGIDTGRP